MCAQIINTKYCDIWDIVLCAEIGADMCWGPLNVLKFRIRR